MLRTSPASSPEVRLGFELVKTILISLENCFSPNSVLFSSQLSVLLLLPCPVSADPPPHSYHTALLPHGCGMEAKENTQKF